VKAPDAPLWTLPAEELRPASFSGPLGIEVHRLCEVTGLAPHQAALAVCMVLACVVGPSRRIREPQSRPLPTTMHLAFLTATPLPLRSSIRELFGPVFGAIQRALKKSALENRDWLEESLAGARLRLLHLDDVIDNPAPPSTNRQIGGIKYDAKLAAMMNKFDDQEIRKQAEAERDGARRQLTSAEFHANPDILVDELTAREMIASSGLSPDGALLNLSPQGLTLKSLTSAGARDMLERIARLFRSAWDGTPGPHLSCPRPSAELLSNLWVVTPNQWNTAARLKAVKDAGVLDYFVVIRTGDLRFRSDTPEPSDNAGWFREISLLYEFRRLGLEAEHVLSAEAEECLLKFSNQINAALPGLPAHVQSFVSMLPALTLKLGLLIHLGTHDPGPPKPVTDDEGFIQTPPPPQPEYYITGSTLALALRLTCHVAREQLALICPSSVKGELHCDDDRHVQVMVGKLRKHGPMRKRILYRRYPKHDYKVLDPVLARAEKMGLITRRGRLLSATEAAVSSQVPVSVASAVPVTADTTVPTA